ncbi:hypothetical protein BN136_1974 [Cronobacter universalis NCTC 9529]|nr:hypothetical protein BN136_1974 [Cronobacter universalis NCTC 9529]
MKRSKIKRFRIITLAIYFLRAILLNAGYYFPANVYRD